MLIRCVVAAAAIVCAIGTARSPLVNAENSLDQRASVKNLKSLDTEIRTDARIVGRGATFSPIPGHSSGLEANASVVPGTNVACNLRPASASLQPGEPDWSRAKVVRDLQGAAALSYIAAREAADPVFRDARQKAAAMLLAQGFRPTGYARVASFQVPKAEPLPDRGMLARLLNLVAPRVSAEEYEGYDIIPESWDDGDNSTWEGNVWVQELSTGYWMSSNEQQQLPEEPYWANWASQVSTNMQPQQRCRKVGSACGYCGETSAIRCNLQNAMNDRWPYCAGGALACAAAGPGWLGCAGLNCWGQLFGGWIWQTKQHLQQCWLDEAERIACGG